MVLRTTLGRFVAAGALLALAAGSGACNREPEAPVARIEMTTPLAKPAEPMEVRGCIRAGEAANTFVLTAAVTETGMPAANYALTGAQDVDLSQYVGNHVEVHGVITEAQQRTTASATDFQEPEERGTTGTPAVATTTEVQFRELEVRRIRPVEGSCEP
jgi:hypothetical protein